MYFLVNINFCLTNQIQLNLDKRLSQREIMFLQFEWMILKTFTMFDGQFMLYLLYTTIGLLLLDLQTKILDYKHRPIELSKKLINLTEPICLSN